ncbi:MAG TPA: hypothetical protein VF338_07835 [Leptolinea sp.]
MKSDEMITNISKQDFDVSHFSNAALEDQSMRDELVHQMLTHPHIMVYYHCFYAIEKACQEGPKCFYEYWDGFSGLLDHPNSYHRNFGLVLISMLAGVDVDHNLDVLLPKYLNHMSDEKYLTSLYCVQGCTRIIQVRPDLSSQILDRLLAQDADSPYSDSQAALLKAEILNFLDQFFAFQLPDEKIIHWIVSASTCASPKTRKKAKELLKKVHVQQDLH